jgi:hypothetical protein
MPGVDDPGKHDAGTAQAITSLGPGFFADHMCPGDRYAPPIDHHAEARYNFTAFDLLSPTSQVREIIWKVSEVAVTLGLLDHPYDVIEEAVKPFSGDWAAFAGCADTFQHLADAVNDAGTCVMDGVSAIPQVWTGNAADQCAGGLARFSTDLTAAVGPLRATANAYASTAEQVRAHAEVLAALLTILIDEVAEAALAAVGGGLMEEFQIATTIEDSVQTILKMRKVVVTAWHVARAFAETGSVTTADLGILRNDHPMPNLIANVPSLPH